MIYSKVKNDAQLRVFNSIWTRSWEEKGFELEYSQQADRYLINNRRAKRYVATLELKPFDGPDAEINTAFPFWNYPYIRDNLHHVCEVDKISILKEYRGRGTLNGIFFTMLLHALRHNTKYYVALIDPYLYEAVVQGFKLPAEQLGEKIFYKGEYAIPMVLSVEYFLEKNFAKNLLPKPKGYVIGPLKRWAWWSVFRLFYLSYRLRLNTQGK